MIVDGNDPRQIAQAAQCLARGELVGLPTETVYGLGADAMQDAAVAGIYAAKGRPADHPLIVHVIDAHAALRFARDVPAFAQRLMDAFWPGPLTLILPRRPGVASACAAQQDSIGLRCPSHPVARALLIACAQTAPAVIGIAAPSANRFGRISPTTAAHVAHDLGDALLVLDGGPCAVGIESTIVDCTRGAPVLLRPGAITGAQVEAACGLSLAHSAPGGRAAPRASGTLEAHYAPRAQVRLLDAADLAHLLPDAAVAVYSRHAPHESVGRGAALWRRMPADAALAAHELFAVLRELDATGVTEIIVERPPVDAAWDGVRDRLQRAAAASLHLSDGGVTPPNR
jgi:L-threonylcarbamoyladenylate synthase